MAVTTKFAKSYRTSAALMATGAIIVGPVTVSRVDQPVPGWHYDVNLAAASAANVPVNLFNMIMSIPAWEVQAMNRLADAMIATGSWQVWGPTNVFGFDEEDPPKLAAIIDMLIPVAPVSSAVGEQLNWWARANFPMNPGCAAQPNACPDAVALINGSLKVPMAQLYQGYQFPVVTNPFTGAPTSWSGQYVKLERGAALTALSNYLTATPTRVETVSLSETLTTMRKLAKSMSDAFYPFVQNSQWFDEQHAVLAPLFRSLAPALCPSCDPDNPYDNPWLKNYSPATGQRSALAPAAAVPASDFADVPGDLGPDVADDMGRGIADHARVSEDAGSDGSAALALGSTPTTMARTGVSKSSNTPERDTSGPHTLSIAPEPDQAPTAGAEAVTSTRQRQHANTGETESGSGPKRAAARTPSRR